MGAMKTLPQPSNTRIVNFLNKQINSLAAVKTQRQIALECGYEKPNIISMFKRGDTKVPLEKIPALAKALEVDPAMLFRLALEQYWPDMQKVVTEIFGRTVTKHEFELIQAIRAGSEEEDPKITADQRKKIVEIINKKK